MLLIFWWRKVRVFDYSLTRLTPYLTCNHRVPVVELSNDYSLWPHSRMSLTSLVGWFSLSWSWKCRTTFLFVSVVIDPLSRQQNTHAVDAENRLHVYASAMIASLRMERDMERKTHQQTVQHAEARVLFLEAKLARREAELELCVLHTCDCSRTPEWPPSNLRSNDSITENEAIEVLKSASANNKTLELEVRSLAEQVSPVHLMV